MAIIFYLLNIVNSVAVKIKCKHTQKQTMLLFLEYYGNRAIIKDPLVDLKSLITKTIEQLFLRMETKLFLNVKQIQWILIYYLYSLINNNTWDVQRSGGTP